MLGVFDLEHISYGWAEEEPCAAVASDVVRFLSCARHPKMFRLKSVPLLLGLTLARLAFSGTPPDNPQIAVTDINGVQHRLVDKNVKATVLFLISNDCPISNSYAPEINRIVCVYTPRKIAVFVVYVDATVPLSEIRRHAREFGFQVPILIDRELLLVHRVRATATPEAAVLAPDNNLVYLGRIDDLYYDYGKRRSAPTKHELRDALDAILSGKPLPISTTTPIGCFISEGK